ncbi:MAG: helix-turn-helix domain-containing protein [Candidatus Eremiobacteraeota bacterium]|nr:helix-turn-helix domain-containing protein [Candidatus Eremiobacteraeota bacterium]
MIAQLDDTKYAAVLGQYKPRPIHTEEDNERAIETLESLHADDTLTPEQEALAEILTTLIEKFEEERYALRDASPAEILRELLQANGLKRKDLAEMVGPKGIASEITNGKRRISRSLAEIFAKRFNVPYRLFL